MDWHVQWDGPASGVRNMAKDAYCLAQVAAGAPPVLRLYTWDGWTLSVGRGQHVERQIDLAACRRLGVPLVRRPTGGRAVLHGEDLTYSLCARLDQPRFQGGIMAIYREVAAALREFLRGLGLTPQVVGFDHRERAQASSPVCFATPSAYEILLDGKKIVGSAQRLLPTAFLQHGSLPLRPQGALLEQVFLDGAGAGMARHMTDLETLGCFPAYPLPRLCEMLVEAFGRSLGVTFVPAPWGLADEQALRHLMAEPQWKVEAAPLLAENPPARGAGVPA